ncbi:hypothetical protein KC340_g10864 [Hortaea werneckii]|nr:hypothetical protein KC342_g11136 [Hortaea werneckii]KAI7087943.1 hypothetical protein KC339_g12779 [Hortaea werneckii]KAI7228853.1 hypothetical protein KC365_g8282 [Hortaea werneckii]KAI7309022.1 hypothetical protein KC340_g10864 [Hortaea werneckii]KAI7394320.1 hypothetical protein KC328_g6207 [Hortaea werneckii]
MQLNPFTMSTLAETIELTYEGIGKDMMIHRYLRHFRRRTLDQKAPQLPHRVKAPSHTLMQHRKDTIGKTTSLPNPQVGTNRTKGIPIRSGAWQRTIPFVQRDSPGTKDLPPTHLPHSQKPVAQFQSEAASQPSIPADLLDLAQYINHLPRNPRGRRRRRRRRSTKTNEPNSINDADTPNGQTPSPSSLSSSPAGVETFPSRNVLKRDPNLKGAISRKTGCLLLEKSGARLRRWWGDERLFSKGLWRFLTEEGGSGAGRREFGDGE